MRRNPQFTATVIAGIIVLAGAAPAHASGPRDLSFELPATEIKGEVLEPRVLREPWIPKTLLPPALVDAEVTDSMLDTQRTLVARAKHAADKRAVQIKLAAMLYKRTHDRRSNAQDPLEESEKTQLTEARQILRDVVQHTGDDLLDEGVWRLLAVCELLLGDYGAAEQTWRTLLEENPRSKDRSYHRAWLAHALLKQFKDPDAFAAVAAETLDDTQFELAYVTAWARWRQHDGAGALQAIAIAQAHWQEAPCNVLTGICLAIARNGGQRALDREVARLAARVDIPASQAVVELKLVAKDDASRKSPGGCWQCFEVLGIRGYGAAGRWADGIATLDKGIATGGERVFRDERVFIRLAQAEFAIRLDDPAAAATYAAQAVDALAECGAPCSDEDKADVLRRIQAIARLCYRVYTTSGDPRYHDPSRDLYTMTMPLLGSAATPQAQREAAALETASKRTAETSGSHDQDVVRELLGLHDREIAACYEASLDRDRGLAGGIALELDADATGAMQGVMAQPVASVAQLSAVASCIAEHARQWRLPRRGGAGTTHIKLSYTLSPGGPVN